MFKKKKNNFLKPIQGFDKKILLKNKKIKRNITIGILVFFGISILLLTIFWSPTKKVYSNANSGKDNFLDAQNHLINQDFDLAKISLDNALNDFTNAQIEFSKFKWLKIIPWVGTQVKAVENLLSAGIQTGEGIAIITNLADDIITPYKGNDELTLSSLSEEETRSLLKSIYESKESLETAKSYIDEAVDSINNISTTSLIRQLKTSIDPLKEQIPEIQKGVNVAISASQIIPSISGYPEQKSYLFLLQNNTEMRPAGGFIGTYGILKILNGDIKYFKTNNVYNLDEPSSEYLFEDPPWPLTRYNDVHQWFLRDSNWSPDFPTSAQKAEWFYQKEKGPEKIIDGIIAVTPTFIESLISITGDIDVNGLTFNNTNFTELLQYQVEKGYLRQGINDSERKEIIGILSQKILDKILDLPQEKWPDLWSVISQDINEKQMLIYSKDDYVQSYIIKENWGGQIRTTPGDYLQVVDANLASLKTDPAVHRTIEYSLRQDNKNLIADVNITYDHQGDLTWKTTRYRTYTRIYVPQGSTLLKSTGSMMDCKDTNEASVETIDELNKTSFGTFICIEPKESKTLHFKYKLPDKIHSSFTNDNEYNLLVQKQPGSANHDLLVHIEIDDKVKEIEPIDNLTDSINNIMKFSTTLNQDLEFLLKF